MSNLPPRSKDWTGQRFGRLVAKEYAHSDNGAIWRFLCDCGNISLLKPAIVVSGIQRSCGCLSRESRFADLNDIAVGARFGRLVAMKRGPRSGHNNTWVCLCDCGVEISVLATNLRSGNTQSCGCLKAETAGDQSRTHGMTYGPGWHVWAAMKARCSNPANPAYHRYGGRGIRVCERWKSFENFFADMGPPPVGKTLDRIDNNKGYEPGNCRWATRTQQARNTRRNVLVTIDGETASIAEWAERAGMPYQRIWARKFVLGWADADLLNA